MPTVQRGDPQVETFIAVDVDVAIIGNGPAGIVASYALSGHVPYYDDSNGPHPIQMLHSKLSQNKHISLVDQNLAYLSEGLEGRSNNPIAVLFDQLQQPNADVDFGQPERIRWVDESRERKRISHIVLGRDEIGGSWSTMHPTTETVSLGSWLQLPGYSIAQWARDHHLNLSVEQNRLQFGHVAKYYKDYVAHMKLGDNFLSNVEVTCLRRLVDLKEQYNMCACTLKLKHMALQQGNGKKITCDDVECMGCDQYTWLVRGNLQKGNRQLPLLVRAHRVILAGGMFDIPRQLDIPGQDLPNFVRYSTADLESLDTPNVDARVVVVGAGISAADCVLALRKKGYSVVHIFKHRHGSRPLSKCPSGAYPEYYQLYRQMRKGHVVTDGSVVYEPLQDASVVSISSMDSNEMCCSVTVDTFENKTIKYNNVAAVFVLIGKFPCLGYLPPSFLASLPSVDLHHPIPVDRNTFLWHSRQDLYAIGSLVGDNFVRFVTGGAIAAAAHIRKTLKQEDDVQSDGESEVEEISSSTSGCLFSCGSVAHWPRIPCRRTRLLST